jgi:hypothetical protein
MFLRILRYLLMVLDSFLLLLRWQTMNDPRDIRLCRSCLTSLVCWSVVMMMRMTMMVVPKNAKKSWKQQTGQRVIKMLTKRSSDGSDRLRHLRQNPRSSFLHYVLTIMLMIFTFVPSAIASANETIFENTPSVSATARSQYVYVNVVASQSARIYPTTLEMTNAVLSSSIAQMNLASSTTQPFITVQ